MKYLIIVILSLVSGYSLANPVPLPNVQQEAKKALDAIKEYNPIADCIMPSMFSSQSPLQSSKQIGNCVSLKLETLELPEALEVKDKMQDLNSDGAKLLNKFKNCWQSFESLKNCLPEQP